MNHCGFYFVQLFNFILQLTKESVVLVGAKRKAQVAGNISAMGWNLTDNDMEMLKRVSSEEII